MVQWGKKCSAYFDMRTQPFCYSVSRSGKKQVNGSQMSKSCGPSPTVKYLVVVACSNQVMVRSVCTVISC